MENTLENVKKNLEEFLSFLEFPEEGKGEAVEMFLHPLCGFLPWRICQEALLVL